MNKKTKLSAIVLFALVSASPVQAFDWFDSWFGSSVSSGEPGVDPLMKPMGGGAGGGDPPGPIDPD